MSWSSLLKWPQSQHTKTILDSLIENQTKKELERPDIFPGAVLEVWLQGDSGPKPCVIIEEDLSGPSGDWRVLAGEAVIVLKEDRIFQPGKATRPPSAFAMPLIRRVFPTLLANQLVSIQPMTAPSATCFYLDYTYGDKKTVQYSASNGKTAGNDTQETTKARPHRSCHVKAPRWYVERPSHAKGRKRAHVRRAH